MIIKFNRLMEECPVTMMLTIFVLTITFAVSFLLAFIEYPLIVGLATLFFIGSYIFYEVRRAFTPNEKGVRPIDYIN